MATGKSKSHEVKLRVLGTVVSSILKLYSHPCDYLINCHDLSSLSPSCDHETDSMEL